MPKNVSDYFVKVLKLLCCCGIKLKNGVVMKIEGTEQL